MGDRLPMAARADLEAREAGELALALAPRYLLVRVLPDGSVAALGELLFTRAIYLGLTQYGYGRRYCFSDRDLAVQRFAQLQGEDDEPAGFTARRGG